MTTRGIDFARLTLVDALDLAVLIEEEARDRYEELADQLELHHTAEAARFFRKMVHVEEKHRTELVKRRRSLFGDGATRVDRAMLFDVEAPDYDVARASMSLRAALEASMVSEKKAHDFFAAAIPSITDPHVRALFAELREEELEHQKWVQSELDRPEAKGEVGGDDWSDDPVAH